MIDVIIPAYNAHKTIEQTLCSVVYQDMVDKLNIYIVNDGSEQSYEETINFFSYSANVKELNIPENKGPGYARQYGIDHSDSEYIVFIDADDVFSNCFALNYLYNAIEENHSDVVIGNFVEEVNDTFYNHDGDTIWLHGKIYRRSFLIENGIRFSNTKSNEDNGFNQLLFLCKPQVFLLDKNVYIWRNNSISITRNNDHEYEYKSLTGYVYNINYALENSLHKDFDVSQFAHLSFSCLVSSYYYYLQFYDKEQYINEMLNLSKKTLDYYLLFPLNEQDKMDIIENQFNHLFNKDTRDRLLNPIISFEKFIYKLLYEVGE